ncbi:Protein kinase domain-containing protein [Mycena venus]|uniref:Protein kinase domain-containing protein n=1 Tax=Mycena venus TaxID=2733690 RepID=A0A8H6XAS9_9AGAR|nr:Protein kinase domain-containing protein [Mycena venus]
MVHLEAFWRVALSGTDENGDLWFWEHEDERCIEEFIADRHFPLVLQMPVIEWEHALRALEARQRCPPANRLSQLAPRTRLLFFAWLVSTELRQKPASISDGRGVDSLIKWWALSLDHPTTVYDYVTSNGSHCTPLHAADNPLRSAFTATIQRSKCAICGTSHLLKEWMDTMLQVHAVDDLRAVRWCCKCTCFNDELDAHLGYSTIHPETNSVIQRTLSSVIVPPWPLILWVTFRRMANECSHPLDTFFQILRGHDQELFVWDDTDDIVLYRALTRGSPFSLYCQDWNELLADIDFETWHQISDKTFLIQRPRPWLDDLRIRLAVVVLKFSSMSTASQGILNPARFPHFPFLSITTLHAVHKKHRIPDNIDRKEFWTASNLKTWLLARGEQLCHMIWHTSRITILERLQYMRLVLTGALEDFLPMYTYSLILQHDYTGDMLRELWDFTEPIPKHRGFLESLRNYRIDLDSQFALLKYQYQHPEKDGSKTLHVAATEIYNHMNLCISVAVAGLVLFLQDRASYKALLAYRATDAQTLLDLFQDFLDLDSFWLVKPMICKALWRLSRASGLHPKCFSLTGLQKVGHQVGAGGYGDIWKGRVGEQSVCVKMMRIFQEADIQAILKDFGREALIWRQLCHPNLLPFFGLYYVDNRLCLVSPWMERGNIMEFLRSDPPDTDRRLSLASSLMAAIFLADTTHRARGLKGGSISL